MGSDNGLQTLGEFKPGTSLPAFEPCVDLQVGVRGTRITQADTSRDASLKETPKERPDSAKFSFQRSTNQKKILARVVLDV